MDAPKDRLVNEVRANHISAERRARSATPHEMATIGCPVGERTVGDHAVVGEGAELDEDQNRARIALPQHPRTNVVLRGKLHTGRSCVSLVFLDFAASSLSSHSHPIEIGCAWIKDDRVVHLAELIRPDPTWQQDWSAESATVHGIHREVLAHAEPAVGVAWRFAALLTGRTIVSDAPEFDGRWLGRLFELLPHPPSLRVVDFDGLLHVAMSHEAQRAAYANLARASSPHRAGGDAARLATAWLAGLRAERG